MLQILDPKNGFQVKFQTQNMARTPPYANMASTPPGFQQRCWIWNSPVQRPTNTAL